MNSPERLNIYNQISDMEISIRLLKLKVLTLQVDEKEYEIYIITYYGNEACAFLEICKCDIT